MEVRSRNHVTCSGTPGARPVLFAHGLGCDQTMWRLVTPFFADSHFVVTFDYVGSGRSDVASYDRARYSSLEGYASDVIEICDELALERVTFVGHSVSSIVGVLAANRRPGLFERLVMIGPSARYVDDGDYVGGFAESDVAGLLESLDSNYLGWSSSMGSLVVANPERPELAAELAGSILNTAPEIARQFASVTFLSDHRRDLDAVTVPTLILQSREDAISPIRATEYVHEHVAGSRLVLLDASGHCPHLSAPEQTAAAILAFL